jgi:hypothetical protein
MPVEGESSGEKMWEGEYGAKNVHTYMLMEK